MQNKLHDMVPYNRLSLLYSKYFTLAKFILFMNKVSYLHLFILFLFPQMVSVSVNSCMVSIRHPHPILLTPSINLPVYVKPLIKSIGLHVPVGLTS
jgi:hypothetical protein